MCVLQGLVSLDKNSMQATFRAGTTFKEVNAILREHGLAMSQLGSISDQTVAGAIATGTYVHISLISENCPSLSYCVHIDCSVVLSKAISYSKL